MDRIDYEILSLLPIKHKEFLLDLFNNFIFMGSFPEDWHRSLVIFIPKPGGAGVRPISLLSCILKILEKCIYYRLRWFVESNDILPDTQFGFRPFRSCNDNLIILSNYIQTAFLKNQVAIAVFLYITGAFDNVVPSLLINELLKLGIPARIRKFIAHLLLDRQIFIVRNGEMVSPFNAYKGTPQGSILSPLLFNIYLRDINKGLHPRVKIIQYAVDIALFCSDKSVSNVIDYLQISLNNIYSYLSDKGLEISPSKSSCVIFSRRRNLRISNHILNVNNEAIPIMDKVKFLGIWFDSRLSGRAHLSYLVDKGRKILNVISALAGIGWGAQPIALLTIYKAIFRSAIEYGAAVFRLKKNKSIFIIIQRLQYKCLRIALGYRLSTPINVILDEAKEPPLVFRFSYMMAKYIIKNLSLLFNPVIDSLAAICESFQSEKLRTRAFKDIPVYRSYRSISTVTHYIHSSAFLPAFYSSYESQFARPECRSLEISHKEQISNKEIQVLFQEATSSLRAVATEFYTDGSKISVDLGTGAAVYVPRLNLKIRDRLPAGTSVFSAEAWAILQALVLISQFEFNTSVIFSDSKSVLDSIMSNRVNHPNYLIAKIREKIHFINRQGWCVTFFWIPSHKGILGNEIVDNLAKQAIYWGNRPKFKIPFPDLYEKARSILHTRFENYLQTQAELTGTRYFELYHNQSLKPWFQELKINRAEIVLINRIRSNHYNLNYSLHRKNIVSLPACDCGASRQDINHIIFWCPIRRKEAGPLIKFLKKEFPYYPTDIFPILKTPNPKLCRLLLAFCKSCELFL